MTSRAALTKARRGAAFLDQKLGRGWRRKISRTRLDMAEPELDHRGCGCILTQLYGDYDVGLAELELRPFVREIELGFEVPDDDPHGYADLTEAWLEVLREKA